MANILGLILSGMICVSIGPNQMISLSAVSSSIRSLANYLGEQGQESSPDLLFSSVLLQFFPGDFQSVPWSRDSPKSPELALGGAMAQHRVPLISLKYWHYEEERPAETSCRLRSAAPFLQSLTSVRMTFVSWEPWTRHWHLNTF